MEDRSIINADISNVMNDIAGYLQQTRDGMMIDMSSLPDKIVRLQSRVQSAPKPDRLELTNFMNQMMQSLDTLSHEIQQRHDTLARDVINLESGLHKE